MLTYSSANTGGNSTWTIVATSLATSPSTLLAGVANTPGVVGRGGSTVKAVVTVVYGADSRCAAMRLSPAAQEGPPNTIAVALPSLSSSTEKLGPDSLSTPAPRCVLFVRRPPVEPAVAAAVELVGADPHVLLGIHFFALDFDDVGDARGGAELTLVHELAGQGVHDTRFRRAVGPASRGLAFLWWAACANAVPLSRNRLSARTASPARRLRLSMTSSSDFGCHPPSLSLGRSPSRPPGQPRWRDSCPC